MQTLKQLRVSRDYTLEFVAAYIGKSRKTLENYENNMAHTIKFKPAARLAELYGISLEELSSIIFPDGLEDD